MKLCLGLVLAGLVTLLSSAGAFVSGPYCAGVPPESSAISTLRTINTAEIAYKSSENRYGTMEELVTAGLLDSRFLQTVSDYNFAVSLTAADYRATAEPGVSKGRANYYSGPDAVVRYGHLAHANLIDLPVF